MGWGQEDRPPAPHTAINTITDKNMSKSKRPDYYAAPLRSRKAIIAFLIEHPDYHRSMSTCSPLAWNVKLYGIDLSYDNLVKKYKESGYAGPWIDFPEFTTAAKAKYDEHEKHLWEWGVEDASRGVNENDSNKTLWSGTELDVEYVFAGRSGGWLLMHKFEGKDFTRFSYREEFEEYLSELPFRDLRNLYQLVVQNDHDFAREQVVAEVEYLTAFTFFENVCNDIPRFDRTQLELPLTA